MTESKHPRYAFVGYRYTGSSSVARIRLTLQASVAGQVRQGAVVLHIAQRRFGSCGDYGGPGYAVVDSHLRLSASHFHR